MAAASRLRAAAQEFRTVAGSRDWSVVWAAGAATTSTREADAIRELAVLERLLDAVGSALPQGRGGFFLASSAGGVYAGSRHPPFDDRTVPAPLSAYGELKLRQERLALDSLRGLCPVTIGRISNLYGPGQNLSKLQGLVSRLALAAVTQQPINIFVSLDTIRDYIYADDAARAVMAASARARERQDDSRVEVIASGQPATIAQLIRTMNQVARRRVPVALGMHPSAGVQTADLRVTPTFAPGAVTPLPAGMKAIYLDILARVQRESLTA